ncbi:MAG TPA: hypothetical protein PKX74_11355 [Leptospiraceae bacterium]|jgi:hypothetical protein|nr:hypothetical protein [Leptospirales bacterium]HMU83940.1 hypothetical protein [Leptospiraceae bacterium]HMY46069.1 hypothetical protein [Leptospiraceae bacterium]HMZ36974.1 hypothetical protein [Leptospiraceae bacterium]HNE23972.1 hypothetical protein [Leptospiraceae bacterium]
MRKLVLLGALLLAGSAEAATYRLFVHGRSGDNHCQPITSTASATNDHNNYWGGTVTGLANVRYVGFDGTQNGGAYSWNSCGAQKQLNDAVRIFCTGGNTCEIYTHSTGGLVAAAYFGLNNPSGLSISRIQLLASAAGGSELADISTTYLSWLGIKTLGGQLDQSVSTRGARNGFNHNNAGGRTFYTTSGEGSDYWNLTSPFLPGKDDGVLANHSLCSVNSVTDVGVSCTRGSAAMSESYRCGFLWLSTCHKSYGRWTPYYTVYTGGSNHSHGDAKADYNRR